MGSVVKDGKPLKLVKVVNRDGDHNLEVSFDPTQTRPTVLATGMGEEGEPVAVAMGGGEESDTVKSMDEDEDDNEYEDDVEDEDEEDDDNNDDFMEPVLQVKRKEDKAMQGPKKKVASKHKLTKVVQAVKKRDHFSMTTRCQPNDILEKVSLLKPPQRDRLHDLDFVGFSITPDVVYCVMGLQNGHLDPPVASDTAPLGPIWEELGPGRKEKIFSLSILDKIKEGGLTISQCSQVVGSKLEHRHHRECSQHGEQRLGAVQRHSPLQSAERWKSGKRSTVYGCTAFLVLRCRVNTCYFVSKGKRKVVAANENTRKRKHMDEEAAQEATLEGFKEALVLVVTSQAFTEAEQIVCNLHKAQDHQVNVLTLICTTSDTKIAYTQKSKRRRDGLPSRDSQAVTDKISGNKFLSCVNDNTTQASIDTPPTQANDDLGEEQSKGGVESLAPMHVEDPTHVEAGQPCAGQQMHIMTIRFLFLGNDVELSNLVDKICTNVKGTPMPAITPSLVANPSPVIMPIEMGKRRPLANPKYTCPFKCASTEPLWDDNGDNATEVYKIVCNSQLPNVER
uniref:Uncharacterized protein n=1 Tax=Oryza glumipatula TaxID=40148 RepID=A0A0E0AIV2_9ORYZ